MMSFRQMRWRFNVDGFHGHHLIPKQVSEHRYFAKSVGNWRAAGLNLDDFEENGMHLPNSERLAEIFQLPLHRGGHPQYNAMVSEQVARLICLPTYDALLAMRLLQLNLRACLRFSARGSVNSLRDPMSAGLSVDMDAIGLMGDCRAKIVRIL